MNDNDIETYIESVANKFKRAQVRPFTDLQPQRRVFNIDISDIDPSKVEEYIQKIKGQKNYTPRTF